MAVEDLIKVIRNYKIITIIDTKNMKKLYSGKVEKFLDLKNNYILNKEVKEINYNCYDCFNDDFLERETYVYLIIYI